jgi:hypothetical protein
METIKNPVEYTGAQVAHAAHRRRPFAVGAPSGNAMAWNLT